MRIVSLIISFLLLLLSFVVYADENIFVEDKGNYNLPPPHIEWAGLGLSFDTEEYDGFAYTLEKPIRRSRDLGGVDPRYGDKRYGIFSTMSPVRQTLLAQGAFGISFYLNPGKYDFKFEITSNGKKYVEEHYILAKKYKRSDFIYPLIKSQIKPNASGQYNVCIKVHFNQYIVHNHCYN